MKILMVTAESAPFAQIGGLSQVVLHLSRALIKKRHDVRVFMPKYGFLDETHFGTDYLAKGLIVPTGHPRASRNPPHQLICNVKIARTKSAPLTYFLENQEYYELRSNVYGYSDDAVRFFLLARGVLEWLLGQRQNGGWFPDLIHTHDWHTSYLVEEARRNPRYRQAMAKTALLLTIHNARYQGPINYLTQPEEKRDRGRGRLRGFLDPELINQNPLLRAVITADWVNTVSESYMRELQTEEYGEGLAQVIRQHKEKLSGILNGINRDELNPETDPNISYHYSWRGLAARAKNKVVLQEFFKLPTDDRLPVLAYVGRLVSQKGIDLIIQAVPHLMKQTHCQLVIVGTGDETYQDELRRLRRQYPRRIGLHLYKDFLLPRKIFAGADLMLIPSRFEPAGIVPMEAMRYGCVPIVTRTGGLVESVTEFSLKHRDGRGFTFERKQLWGLLAAVIRALFVYDNQRLWQRLVQNGMRAEFSWPRAARQYERLYQELIVRRRNRAKLKSGRSSNET